MFSAWSNGWFSSTQSTSLLPLPVVPSTAMMKTRRSSTRTSAVQPSSTAKHLLPPHNTITIPGLSCAVHESAGLILTYRPANCRTRVTASRGGDAGQRQGDSGSALVTHSATCRLGGYFESVSVASPSSHHARSLFSPVSLTVAQSTLARIITEFPLSLLTAPNECPLCFSHLRLLLEEERQEKEALKDHCEQPAGANTQPSLIKGRC